MPRGSHRGGKSAGSSLGKRGTVEHWRLVDDIVEPRARDVILRRTRMQCHWARPLEHAFPPVFHPLALSLHLILQGRLHHNRGDSLASWFSHLPNLYLSDQREGPSSNSGQISQSPCSFHRGAILSSTATVLWGDFGFCVIREMYWCACQPSWTGAAKPEVRGG